MKKRAAILGATGLVGRRLTAMPLQHPWFEPTVLIGSAETMGKAYADVWKAKESDRCRHYGSDLWQPQDIPAALSLTPSCISRPRDRTH